jgi:hypothetical protein
MSPLQPRPKMFTLENYIERKFGLIAGMVDTSRHLYYLIKMQPDYNNDPESLLIEYGQGPNRDSSENTVIMALQGPEEQYRPLIRMLSPTTAHMGIHLGYLVWEWWRNFACKLINYETRVMEKNTDGRATVIDDLLVPVKRHDNESRNGGME